MPCGVDDQSLLTCDFSQRRRSRCRIEHGRISPHWSRTSTILVSRLSRPCHNLPVWKVGRRHRDQWYLDRPFDSTGESRPTAAVVTKRTCRTVPEYWVIVTEWTGSVQKHESNICDVRQKCSPAAKAFVEHGCTAEHETRINNKSRFPWAVSFECQV